MDFETAITIASQVEKALPSVTVIGVRRMSYSRPHDSWALDVMNPRTGQMATLDEKDDWESRLRELFPDAEAAAAHLEPTPMVVGEARPHRRARASSRRGAPAQTS